jgi:predicted alpha-1,2-mannosidase
VNRVPRLFAVLVVLAASLASSGARASDDFARHVNPFVGTAHSRRDVKDTGATFPGAAVPFGMLQWSPDTDSPLAGGYNYGSSNLVGYSVRHLSGAGCPYTAYGDFPILPSATVPSGSSTWASASFSHANESAAPGAYGVTLDDGVGVALSVGDRFGVGNFTFRGATSSVLIDGARAASATTDASMDVVAPDTITGEHSSGRFCYLPMNYHLYFAARFDRPFSSFGAWTGTPQGTPIDGSHGAAVLGATHGTGAWATFDTSADRVVRMKVAISSVSRQNALMNLDTASSWDSAAVAGAARARWNEMLGRVRVAGGTEDETRTFYTALYHSMLQPSAFSDADGEYLGYDGVVHVADGYTQYTDFSGWDTYRSLIQLQTLLVPHQVNDMMRSLLADAAQGGWLPRWGFANYDTGIMVGDPADAIIANAYAFGARDFDARAALRAMLKGATQTGYGPTGYTMSRPGLQDYAQKGYVPLGPAQYESFAESSSELSEAARNYVPLHALGVWGPTATTMEYAIADFAIAQFARALGDDSVAPLMERRAQNWQHVFDAGTRYPEPRNPDGTFSSVFKPTDEVGFTEGNATQYTFMVPHNPRAVINALGGDEAAIARLDALFTRLNVGPIKPYAWMGYEPGIGSPYVYLHAGAPWKTQALTRRILSELFSPAPDGLAGNDDLGALSAEYVWGALGLHPSMPGSAQLLVGSPLFTHAEMDLPNGATLRVHAPDASADAKYVRALAVNGGDWSSSWLPESLVSAGGELVFDMSETPNLAWGAAMSARPPSAGAGQAHALGFVEPEALALAAGRSANVRFGAVNATDAARTVSWAISPTSDFSVEPSSGTLPLDAAGRATANVVITAAQGTVAGTYVLPVVMRADAGPAMPRVMLSVTVSPQA